MVEPSPEVRAAAQGFVRANTTLDTSALSEALRGAYGDAYALGALSGAEQSNATVIAGLDGVSVPENFDQFWASWEPGNLNAAVKVEQDGLSGLIQGISDTTLDQFGSIISEGLLNGSSVDDIADQLGAFLDDPDRAFTLANTEVANAVVSASQDAYAAAGVEQWEWIDSPDACDDCVDYAEGGPYDVGDGPDMPAHPNCRCAPVPIDPGPDNSE